MNLAAEDQMAMIRSLATARRILAGLQKNSAQFGTQISIEGSVGVIRIP